MTCAMDAEDEARRYAEKAATPVSGSPDTQVMATPAHQVVRPTNPTPGNPKNWTLAASPDIPVTPVTPGNVQGRRSVSPISPRTKVVTPGSINVRHTANASDGLVFTAIPESHLYHGAVDPREPESWEHPVHLPDGASPLSATIAASSSPHGSNQTVITRRELRGTFRSWFSMPDSLLSDLEEQPLLSRSPDETPRQRTQYGTSNYSTCPYGCPRSVWDHFSDNQMTAICAVLTGVALVLVWLSCEFVRSR